MLSDLKIEKLKTKVSMFVDNELTKNDKDQFLMEINKNSQAQELIHQEQGLKSFLKEKLVRKKVSPTLIQSIKDKIRVAHL